MSYFINPVREDRCVFLSYEGETPAVELSAARYEADAVLDRRRWHRLVVDVTQLQSVPTALELFDFASGLSSNIARRGRVFLTYFLDPGKAALWVKQSPGRQISRSKI
jgi:hypothetical protein